MAGTVREAEDRVVMITGATGALGAVAAERFARAGARVASVGRELASLNELGGQLGIGADRWLAVPGELTDTDAAQAVARAVTDRWDRIDVLLHLVGGWAAHPSSISTTMRSATCSISTFGRRCTSCRRSCRG